MRTRRTRKVYRPKLESLEERAVPSAGNLPPDIIPTPPLVITKQEASEAMALMTRLLRDGHAPKAEEYMLAWICKRPGALTKEEWPPEPAAELNAVRQALDEAHAAAIAFVKANPEEALRERCLYGRTGEQTVGGVYFHLIAHEIHHRAFINHKLGKLLA